MYCLAILQIDNKKVHFNISEETVLTNRLLQLKEATSLIESFFIREKISFFDFNIDSRIFNYNEIIFNIVSKFGDIHKYIVTFNRITDFKIEISSMNLAGNIEKNEFDNDFNY